MDIKLIGIDIDGTLVDSRKHLTPPTIDAIAEASRRGIQVVISTGRFLSEYTDLLEQLPMMRYTVTCTGTQVVDLQTGRDIYRCALTAEELRHLYGKLRDLDVLLQIFSEHDGKIHNSTAAMADAVRYCGPALAKLVQTRHAPEENLDAYVAGYTGQTNKIHMFFPGPEPKEEALRRLAGEPYAIMDSAPNDLEIMPRDVDKGLGLLKLADYLGLRADQVAAIGDGGNDVGMLEAAGLGIAMKNASDDAKAAAQWILPRTNDEDGVAFAIKNILKGDLPL